MIRKTIGDIGYTDASYGFDSETCAILISLDEQSPDIAMGWIVLWNQRKLKRILMISEPAIRDDVWLCMQ